MVDKVDTLHDIVDIVETYLTLLKTLMMTRKRMTSRDILPGTTFIVIMITLIVMMMMMMSHCRVDDKADPGDRHK